MLVSFLTAKTQSFYLPRRREEAKKKFFVHEMDSDI